MQIFLLPQSINCLSEVQQFIHPAQRVGGKSPGAKDPGGDSASQSSSFHGKAKGTLTGRVTPPLLVYCFGGNFWNQRNLTLAGEEH